MAEWIGMNGGPAAVTVLTKWPVPGMMTINPAEVDPSFELAGKRYRVPIMAAAMDGVVDVKFAVEMGSWAASRY